MYVNFKFVELRAFSSMVDILLSHEEYLALQKDLVKDPELGDILKGSGGARKVRVQVGTKGKSGGARAICYFQSAHAQIWMLAIYLKSEKENISQSDLQKIKMIVTEIKNLKE